MSLKLSSPSSEPADSAVIQSWCLQHGCEYTDGGDSDVEVKVNRVHTARFTYITDTCTASDEIYELAIIGEPPKTVANITCSGDRGLRYALNALKRRSERGDWHPGSEYDYPKFPARGIVEGFYGKPWSREQRLDMLRFIASRNMNTYVYAPKDDAYHRLKWREPYDGESLGALDEVFRQATSLGLRFCYAIGPGLSMRYSSEEDYAALLIKSRQIYDLGVRWFGLLLDDIPDKLQHREDIATYPDLAAAHVRLINRYYADLKTWDDAVQLAVCPTQYWGKGNEYYITRLGREIHPRIDLFWTGRNICSQEITLHEAALFAQSACRPPLFWDNYPVNDAEMTDELHIGPYRQRDPSLYRFSRGIIANGMEYAESSKIAFATIAAYSWNPHRYDPEAIWEEALEQAVGKADLTPMLRFADNVRYSCLYPTDAPRLAEALTRFDFEYAYGNREEAIGGLERLAAEMTAAAEALHANEAGNPALFREIKRWLDKYAAGCRLLTLGAAHLRDGGPQTLETLRAAHAAYGQDRTYVFADVLDAFLAKLLEQGYTP